ncbi:MAG: hypothetical protein FK734_13130 [Asgard group archaeon]|nr:hypothetical protein [Asgard group archaeon]
MSEEIDLEELDKIYSKPYNPHDDKLVAMYLGSEYENLSPTERRIAMLKTIKIQKETVQRLDYTVYRFSFLTVCQAIAFILAFFMILNAIIFVFYRSTLMNIFNDPYILSWIMFGESGVMILFAAFTVPRSAVVVKRHNTYRKRSSLIRNKRIFAFTHSFTWFVAGCSMVILSTMVHKLL